MEKHNCGGTILYGGANDGSGYFYCDKCRAFVWEGTGSDEELCTSDDVPDGIDEAANRRAYDDGDSQSPEA